MNVNQHAAEDLFRARSGTALEGGDDERDTLIGQLQRRVEELKREREELIRALSHDLRTPLGVILTQAQLIRRAPERPDQVQGRAESIVITCKRMSVMLTDLSEMARLEAGHLELRPRAVELRGFLRDLEERLASEMAGSSRILIDVADASPVAFCDPDHLERLLVHLLSNGLDCSPPTMPVLLSADARGDRVTLTVTDGGQGIPAQDLPRVFTRFYRPPGARHAGLGVGLYLARMLAEAQGGSLSVTSEPGRGSTFTVTLPSASARQ